MSSARSKRIVPLQRSSGHGSAATMAARRLIVYMMALAPRGSLRSSSLSCWLSEERAEQHGEVLVAQLAVRQVDALARAQRRQRHARAAREAQRVLAPAERGADEERGLEAERAGGDAVERAELVQVDAVAEEGLALHVQRAEARQPADEGGVVEGGRPRCAPIDWGACRSALTCERSVEQQQQLARFE